MIYFLFFFSGLAGLGYELTWSRQLGLGMGHEIFSVMAIMAAFLGGLALGAWWLDPKIRHSSRSIAWYASLEAIIGIWGLFSIWFVPWINRSIPLLLHDRAGMFWETAI